MVSIPAPDAGIRIVAVICCPEPALSIIELKTFCGTKLPAYMIPDRFLFQNRLPRTSTDKVDYQTLKVQVSSSCVA